MDLAQLMDIRRAERSSPHLVPIDKGFYAEVKRLLNEVGGKDEFRKIKQAFDDIVSAREQKITAAALRCVQGGERPDLEGLELEVFGKVYESLKRMSELDVDESNGAPNAGVDNEKREVVEVASCVFKSKGDKIRVKFLKPLPAFVSLAGACGPFKEDEETELPAGIAELLLKNGVVEESE